MDNTGNYTRKIFYDWNGSWSINAKVDDIQWFNFSKELYTQAITYIWNGTNFEENTKVLRSYNTDGFITENKSSYWNGSNYVNSSRYTIDYDHKGNTILEMSYSWSNNSWVSNDGTKYFFLYDADGDITTQETLITIGINWKKTEKLTHYYGGYVSVKEENLSHGIQVFPNPAKDKITIEHGDFKPVAIVVYDFKGELVIDKKLMDNAPVKVLDISALNPGIYFIQLINQEQAVKKKFIKNLIFLIYDF
ncbi:MAG: T9SS type A sorting domain-containing protein [Bacteroidetes bacterium]|nr:T9SS type A sorting domain-containing protein [Bacteroidota bacterium]